MGRLGEEKTTTTTKREKAATRNSVSVPVLQHLNLLSPFQLRPLPLNSPYLLIPLSPQKITGGKEGEEEEGAKPSLWLAKGLGPRKQDDQGS